MLTLEANYTKKIGLPGYSSHQYSLTLRTEIGDLTQVATESDRLHQTLQTAVDRELQKVGFLPVVNGNGHLPANGQINGSDTWTCSDKQKELVLKIVEEHRLDKGQVEQIAQGLFGKGVKQLNKLEASGLIEELFEKTGQKKNGRRQFARGGAR